MGCRSCSDKTGAVYARQLTHSLDAQVALHRHQLSDLVVDAVSPAGLLLWRRAPTFCKAPLKKSASSVLSATSRFSCATCCRSSRSFEFSGGPLSVVNRLPLITLLVQQQPMHAQFCRKRDDVIALLQPLDRHLPECLGISPNPSLCHSQSFSLQSVPNAIVSILGSVQSVLICPISREEILSTFGTMFRRTDQAVPFNAATLPE